MMHSRLDLRTQLRQRRSLLSTLEQQRASQTLIRSLAQLPLFRKSYRIALYVAIQREIDPHDLTQLIWQQNKLCYLPVTQGKEKKLVFMKYQPNTPLHKKNSGLPEPKIISEHLIAPQNLDLVIVPVVGFTEQGDRLGTGGGYYDRCFGFLQQAKRPQKPFLLGVAYEWQKTVFQTYVWDVPLNAVMTELAFYENPTLGVADFTSSPCRSA